MVVAPFAIYILKIEIPTIQVALAQINEHLLLFKDFNSGIEVCTRFFLILPAVASGEGGVCQSAIHRGARPLDRCRLALEYRESCIGVLERLLDAIVAIFGEEAQISISHV